MCGGCQQLSAGGVPVAVGGVPPDTGVHVEYVVNDVLHNAPVVAPFVYVAIQLVADLRPSLGQREASESLEKEQVREDVTLAPGGLSRVRLFPSDVDDDRRVDIHIVAGSAPLEVRIIGSQKRVSVFFCRRSIDRLAFKLFPMTYVSHNSCHEDAPGRDAPGVPLFRRIAAKTRIGKR